MAVPRKLVVVQNSATRELWRIAEIGDMDELGRYSRKRISTRATNTE